MKPIVSVAVSLTFAAMDLSPIAVSTARADSDSPILRYGQTRSISPITCASQTSGVTCKDGGTGHYFFLSRDSYEMH